MGHTVRRRGLATVSGAVPGLQAAAERAAEVGRVVLLRDHGQSEHHWQKRRRGGVVVQRTVNRTDSGFVFAINRQLEGRFRGAAIPRHL